jgi:hypothetical protein
MLGQEAAVKQSGGVPAWWPMVVSAVGMIWGTLVLVLHIDMPAFYPVIGLAIFGGAAAYGDKLLKRSQQDGDSE